MMTTGQSKHAEPEPLTVIVDFLKVLQDLLLIASIQNKDLEILENLVEKDLLTDLAFQNILKQILLDYPFDRLIKKFLSDDSTGYLILLKMKLLNEQTNNLLDVLAAKNQRISSHFMTIICERIHDKLFYLQQRNRDTSSGDQSKKDLLISLSLFKEYLSSPSLRKDLLILDPELLSTDSIKKIAIYSKDISNSLMKMKPVKSKKSAEELKSNPSLKKLKSKFKRPERSDNEQSSEEKIRSKQSMDKPKNELNGDAKPKREIDMNLKKLLQMAEKKTLKKVLKEFYSRWVKISEESLEIKQNANIMIKTLNVVEIIVKMRKLDEEIIQQIFKILRELLGSTAHSEEDYIIELIFLMYSVEKGDLRPSLMKNIIDLPVRKELMGKCFQQLQVSDLRNVLIDNLYFMTDFLAFCRKSFHYVEVRKGLLTFLDNLIVLVQNRLITSEELIVRKTVVNLMVEFSFFLDQNLFDPILAQFTIEQQALIKIYITKKLSKESSH